MPLAFQWSSAMRGVEHVHAAHHLVEGAEAQLGHVLAHLLGDEEEEVDDVLGLCPVNLARSTGSCVAMPTGQVFRWHLRIMMQPMVTSGAVAKPNSSAPSSAAITTSRPVCSLPSVCTRMRPRRSFSTSTCCVSARPSSQGSAGVLDGTERRSAGAAVVAGDQHHVGMRLGDARGHRAHAHFGHQLDRDARRGIDVLQVVDQLRQIFDGVDVVVRRRRDQAHAGNGVAHARDDLVHLVAGQLAALAGLGALRHLDLQLVGVDQVIGGDAEAAAGHLLDGAARESPLASGLKRSSSSPPSPVLDLPPMRFMAMASVSCASLLMEPNDMAPVAKRLTISLAGSTSSSGTGSSAYLSFEQAAQRAQMAVLIVDQVGVFLEGGGSLFCRTACCSLLMVSGFSR
jgi:hypothetical protein